MPDLILRNTKGSQLTWTELDGNFQRLENLANSSHPMIFILNQEGNHAFNYAQDFGGGIVSYLKKPAQSISFASGNYSIININWDIINLSLPVVYADSLIELQVIGSIVGTSDIPVTLSNYPNLAFVRLHGYPKTNVIPGQGTVGAFYNFEITDTVINLPKCGSILLGGDKLTGYNKVVPNLTVMIYHHLVFMLSSNTINTLTLDFSNFTYSDIDSTNGSLVYISTIFVSGCTNLTDITINIPYIDTLSFGSLLIFNFTNNNLNQVSVDNILLTLDTNLAQDFTSSTGTYPSIDLSNTSGPFGSSYTVVSGGSGIPDGMYFVGSFSITIQSGSVISLDLVMPFSDTVNNQTVLGGENFYKLDSIDPSRITWRGITGTNDITVECMAVSQNASPTNGTSNANYLSLLSKGWTVTIN